MELNDKGKNIKITSDMFGDIAPKWNYKNFNLEFCKRMAKRLEIMTYKYEQE